MMTISIDELQREARDAGLHFNPDQNGFRVLQLECKPPRPDITIYAVPTFIWPEFGDDAGIQIAHELIRIWRKRDWVTCPRCYGIGANVCCLCEGDTEGGLCDNCGGTGLVFCGQCMGGGRVPPEVIAEYGGRNGD